MECTVRKRRRLNKDLAIGHGNNDDDHGITVENISVNTEMSP